MQVYQEIISLLLLHPFVIYNTMITVTMITVILLSLTKLRISSHKLEIESGRYSRKAVAERIRKNAMMIK